MRSDYSFIKTLQKGLLAILFAASALTAFAGFSDLTINDLYSRYIGDAIGALTIGGLLRMAANYIKFNWL